jgi:hypothetical protein
MDFLVNNNVLIFIGVACALIMVSGIILTEILKKHLWEGVMPYSLLFSILLGGLVIASQSGIFEPRFVVDDAIVSALILLQLILSVLYPLDITKKFENEPGAAFYR